MTKEKLKNLIIGLRNYLRDDANPFFGQNQGKIS